MSITKIIGATAVFAGLLAAQDSPGVHVEFDTGLLLHRAGVFYPEEALRKGIGGTITVQVKLDATGAVSDAAILGGPDELRKAVLQSVLNWHFTRDSALGTRQFAIDFDPAKANSPTAAIRVAPTAAIASPGDMRPHMQQTIRSINVIGLADTQRDALLAQLPVHEGDVVDLAEILPKVTAAVHAFDEHLRVNLRGGPDGLTLMISTPDALAPPPPPPPPPPSQSQAQSQAVPGAIRVGANVQQANLVSKTNPAYPPLAKAARVQGLVRFDATIGPDGTVQNLQLLEGPPLLVQAALQAVQQWVYKPTLLNGRPTSVITTIDVNFTLAK